MLGLDPQLVCVRLHRFWIRGFVTTDEDVDAEAVDLGPGGGDVLLHALGCEVAGGQESEAPGSAHRHGQRRSGWSARHRRLDNRHGQAFEDAARVGRALGHLSRSSVSDTGE